jgi:voltage-gated potassium channel
VLSMEGGPWSLEHQHGVPDWEMDDLASLSLFAGCSITQLAKVLTLGTARTVERGTELIAQGDACREFFVVLGGTARCTVDGRLVALFGPGDFFGDVALLHRGPRTATVRADGMLRVLVFSAGEFQRLLSVIPHLSARMLQIEAERLRASTELISALSAVTDPAGAGRTPATEGGP